MNEQQGQEIKLSAEQMRGAASAGLNLLDRDTTLTPGSMRMQINVLTMVLNGIASGNLVVVSPNQVAVESPDEPQLDAEAIKAALAAVPAADLAAVTAEPQEVTPDAEGKSNDSEAG